MKLQLNRALLALLILARSTAWADTLELKNGSLIKGKFLGGTDSEINYKVGSTVQHFSVADVVSLKFDPENGRNDSTPNPLPDEPGTEAHVEAKPAYVTIPAGTRISIRTIDAIDSRHNGVGDRFQGSLAEPLTAAGTVLAAQYSAVYGRLTEAKESGTFTGRSHLGLELSGIVVNGQTVPVVTGEYEVIGKSRGASTAKRAVGGAALGAIIGAVADGGHGAAIGAGVGGGAGAGSEVIIRGEQLRVPSETLLEFTLQQDVSISVPKGRAGFGPESKTTR